MMKLSVVCAIFAILGVSEAKQGSAGAIGRLLCGERPIEGAIIRLYDHDTGSKDDRMGCEKTDREGKFVVQGKASDPLWTKIDPYLELRVVNECEHADPQFDKQGKPCQRIWRVELPDNFIYDGEEAKVLFDIGDVNLEEKQKGEKSDCGEFTSYCNNA